MTHTKTLASVANRLAAGDILHSGWITLASPPLALHLALEAYDLMILDMQHGAIDVRCARETIAQVLLAGKPTVVRIPVGDFALGSQLLDAGAVGVIAPMINTAKEAGTFASFLKYPPLGERSWGPASVLAFSGIAPAVHLSGANRLCMAVPMIETRAALDCAEQIISVAQVDGVFVGPNDLLINLSGGNRVNEDTPEVDAGMRRIADLCKSYRKYAWSVATTGPRARIMREMGYRVIAVGADSALARQAARVMLEEAKRR